VAAIDDDIKDVARTIWSTLFELPLEDGDAASLGPESTVTSCVQIDGAWQARSCSSARSRWLAP
jgi:hypothetical protein